MKLFFEGVNSELDKGIEILSGVLGFKVSRDGLLVRVEHKQDVNIKVARKNNEALIVYSKKIHFFRALGLLIEALYEQGNFEIIEEPQFEMNGAMFDVCQGNAVINAQNVKELITRMAAMGLNMLMLYVEDAYDIDSEPYFGYMRGRYSFEEMKAFDDYADIFGIEIIPCMQTLAHLIDVLKWKCYDEIKEDDDTLLVGHERTYEFIEKMIVSASAPFRSNRIHIGMDEAWKLGQGNYLLKNGFRSKFDIMTEHLEKVQTIIKKHGLESMIWSDMYFRSASKTGSYYDLDSTIPNEVHDKYPKDVKLVYWDYYHHDEEFYSEWIKRHREFGPEPVFAGGIWSWTGYSVNYGKTFATTNNALSACKKVGLKEVFVTIWGDGATESNIYSNLLGLQLYAEHGYAKELDVDKLKKRFKTCTGCEFEDFMQLSYLDRPYGMEPEFQTNPNASKFLMWQDVMTGLFDKDIEGLGFGAHYKTMTEKLTEAVGRNGEYSYVFSFLAKLSHTLELKADIGNKIIEAYKRNDREQLSNIVTQTLPEIADRVNALRLYHRELWFKINKPFGWEVHDIHYGGLLMRIDSAISRITDYLQMRIEKIEELEEPRLFFNGKEGLQECLYYSKMVSASRLTFAMAF